ncbi:hypothetical protein DV735_g5662, partial [Chaetothyriales sp. CBS 134920]
MSASQHPFAASQVAEKVMRRIEIAKVARNLHDCLAFASFKAQNGWQDRTLKSLQPEMTEKLKRKRPRFDEEDTASEASGFSDDPICTAPASHRRSRPSTAAAQKLPDLEYPTTTTRKRVRSASSTFAAGSRPWSWRQSNGLPQTSPALVNARDGFDADTTPRPAQEDSPMFDAPSDDEGHGAPLPSFAGGQSSSIISSSPPRTPPPVRRQAPAAKQSGADLLLYLANSPSRSPAVHVAQLSSSSKPAPSTPPPQHTHLPSSILNTPGQNMGLFNGALQTPGHNFNFADFCNVTPSPGEAHWGSRTPGPAKTPSRLNYSRFESDNLGLPINNSLLQRQRPGSQGLALQLGEELLPRP